MSPSNTNVGILAAGIYPTLAALRAAAPPLVQRFARVLGIPKLFRFAPLDASTDDAWTAVVPGLGGGAWLDAPAVDRGADLTAANGYPTSGSWTIGVYGGPWRVIPVTAALAGAVAATLDPLNQDGNIRRARASRSSSDAPRRHREHRHVDRTAAPPAAPWRPSPPASRRGPGSGSTAPTGSSARPA